MGCLQWEIKIKRNGYKQQRILNKGKRKTTVIIAK